MEELLIQATAWTNLKSITVNEKAEIKRLYVVCFIHIQEKAKPHEQNRSGLPGADRWNGGLTTSGQKQTWG